MLDLVPTLRMLAEAVIRPLGRWTRRVAIGTGALALVLLILACTRIPFDVHRWLGRAAGECQGPVDMIVVLGGSGMPSGPELLRLHRAARSADEQPHATVVIVHPDTGDAMRQMVQELVLRGVDPVRIQQVSRGDNTRGQALECVRSIPRRELRIALITAPENMYRSVRAFRKAGLVQACGVPAWDHAMPYDFDYAHEAIGGRRWTPDVSSNTGLRYTFWNYLKLEITCLREFLAIGYYRLNGWI